LYSVSTLTLGAGLWENFSFNGEPNGVLNGVLNNVLKDDLVGVPTNGLKDDLVGVPGVCASTSSDLFVSLIFPEQRYRGESLDRHEEVASRKKDVERKNVNDTNHIFGVKGRMQDKRFPACVTPVTRTLLPQWSYCRARPLCKQPQNPCILGGWEIEGFVFSNDKIVAYDLQAPQSQKD
jgi:hypothetical protein